MSAPPRSLPRRTAAPLGRLLRSELRLALARPRTAVTLGVLAVVPVTATIGLSATGGDRAFVLVVQLATMAELAAFALAVPVVLVAADAFAAERARRTLDALALAPVGAVRMVLLKAAGVAAAAVLTAGTATVCALVSGLVALDLGPFGFGATLGRELVLALWMAGQLTALGVLLLPLSAMVSRPAAVTATGLVVVMVAPVLTVVAEWPDAVLPTGRWNVAVAGMSQVPVDWSQVGWTTVRAGVLVALGAAATVAILRRHTA